MVSWLVVGLVLFVIQSTLASSIRYLGSRQGIGRRLLQALGPRDDPPPMPVVGKRADRAFKNLQEAMPVFLSLALVALQLDRDEGLAANGALVFLVFRVLYVPAYLSGIVGVRSAMWLCSWVGLLMMLRAVLSGSGPHN